MWDPDNVERIAPFTPSRHQKQESTWRVDDVDRITPFIPIRHNTWTIDDVDHIESFVPTNNCSVSPAVHSSSSSSSQYDTAMSSPQAEHLTFIPNIQSSLDTKESSITAFRNNGCVDNTSTEFAAQDSETNIYPQLRPFDPSSSQSSRSANNTSTLDTSAEFIDSECSSSECCVSASNSPKYEDQVEEEKLQDVSLECEIQEPVRDKGFNVVTLLRLIGCESSNNGTSSCSVAGNRDASNSSEDEPLPARGLYRSNSSSVLEHAECDLNISNECVDLKCSFSQCSVSSNSSPILDHTQYNLDSLAEYLRQNCSFGSSFRSSHHSATSVPSKCDIDPLVEALHRQCSSNNSVEHTECDLNTSDEHVDPNFSSSQRCAGKQVAAGSSSLCVEGVDDNPLFESAEGSLEMSTELVIEEDKVFDGTVNAESNYTTASCEQQGELESNSTRAETYNPYPFSRTCITATNSFGRGKHLSDSTQVDLKDDYLKRRLRMDADFIPSMGRGAILETYYNRHRTDESLNKQLRTTLGVGYSNEVTENFWRGEQEESEPVAKPSERDLPSPTAAESVSLLPSIPDIILVSPGNTIGPKKSADIILVSPGKAMRCASSNKSLERPPVISAPFEKSGESRGIEFVSPGNTIGYAPPERPPVMSVPFEKSAESRGIEFVSPGNTIGYAPPKKPPERPPVMSVPFEKSAESRGIKFVSPGNMIGYASPKKPLEPINKSASPSSKMGTAESRPSTSSSQDSSPKKKKKAAAAIRKNRNALLSSLAIQKGAERQSTPGMPPGALTYVHLDTCDKYTERNEFRYEKEDFPPLC